MSAATAATRTDYAVVVVAVVVCDVRFVMFIRPLRI